MYPYQRAPMGNPCISPMWVFYGLESPRIPREPNKYHGYTVRGTPNCPLIYDGMILFFAMGFPLPNSGPARCRRGRCIRFVKLRGFIFIVDM